MSTHGDLVSHAKMLGGKRECPVSCQAKFGCTAGVCGGGGNDGGAGWTGRCLLSQLKFV